MASPRFSVPPDRLYLHSPTRRSLWIRDTEALGGETADGGNGSAIGAMKGFVPPVGADEKTGAESGLAENGLETAGVRFSPRSTRMFSSAMIGFRRPDRSMAQGG